MIRIWYDTRIIHAFNTWIVTGNPQQVCQFMTLNGLLKNERLPEQP